VFYIACPSQRERKPGALCHLNVLGAWTFLSTPFGECDLLSFAEVVVAYAFKTVGVKEQVLIAANVNESKTFVSKSFNRAFSHYLILNLKIVEQLNRIIQPESLRGHRTSKTTKLMK